MKTQKIFHFSLISLIIFIFLFSDIPKVESALKCAPDYKSKGDNYSSINDPQDNSEYFYGYEFAHRVGGEYYDHWKGIYWDDVPFCYDAYDNFTRPESLTETYDNIQEFDIISKEEDIGDKESYVLIDHDQTNLVNFHKKMCMTNTHNITNYNHGEYELLVKMDNLFEEKYLDEPHHFVFTIENPSNETVTFAFKSRNFVNTTEYMNDTIIEMGPNISQCIEEEEEEVTDAPEKEKEKEKEDQGTDGTQTPNTDISKDNEDIETDTEKPTTEPCEREIIVVNETYLNWTEEYPIPEVYK